MNDLEELDRVYENRPFVLEIANSFFWGTICFTGLSFLALFQGDFLWFGGFGLLGFLCLSICFVLTHWACRNPK